MKRNPARLRAHLSAGLSCFNLPGARGVLLLVASLLLTSRNANAQAAAPPAGGPEPVSEQVRAQIAALTEEKLKRTPSQRKIDSQFIYAAKAARGESPARGVAMQKFALKRSNNNASRVQVEIKGKITKSLIQRINQLGGTVINSYPDFGSALAWINLDQLEALASHADVKFMAAPPEQERDTGAVNSEGDKVHAADVFRATFPVNASGLKIGVISDSASAAGLATSVAGNEFAPGQVTVLPGQDGGAGSDEGIAMMEIINDICPGAQLFFATAGNTPANFATNILDLRNTYGCDIIVDDIRMDNELPFQDGPVARAVNTVAGNGALYFASAGNSGSKTNNTSGTWVGDFVDGGPLSITLGGTPLNYRVHSFQTSPGVQNYNVVQAGGSSYSLGLFWSDPEGASTNDYDVFQLNADGTAVISQSTNVQDGTTDPYERTSLDGTGGNRIIVVKRDGAQNRALYLTTGRGQLSINTNGFARGHSAASGAIATGAAPAQAVGTPAGPFPNAYSATQQVEQFSSDGPARKFHNPDGSPVTPGNFLIGSGGGSSQLYPVLTAADGVSTSMAGFSPFYGTSAAAPHAAAVAGLLKALKPSLTAAQIRGALTSTALDIHAAGSDNDSGFGIVRPLEAIAAVAEPPAVAITTPGHNSFISGFTGLSGTAVNGGAGIAGNVVNLTLYQVSTGKYWNGTAWASGASTLAVPVTAGTWTYAGALPTNAGNGLAGQYTLSASTFDNKGTPSLNISGVNNIQFTVDTTPPVTTIDAPLNGSTLTAYSYQFGGTATDNKEVNRVRLFIRRNIDNFYWNGSTWIADALAANLTSSYNPATDGWTCNVPLPVPGGSLGNGSYNFIAQGIDDAGNVHQVDSAVTVDYHQIYNWTAGSFSDLDPGNNNLNWGNPANWSPGGVPSFEDIVYIDRNDGVYSTVNRTVYGFHMSTGSVSFTNSSNSLTIRKNGSWTGGTLYNSVNIEAAANFALAGNTTKIIATSSVINNFGTVTRTGGLLLGDNSSAWNNKPGSSFIIAGDGDVFANNYGGNVFNNEAGATLVKTTGAGGGITSTIDDWTFNNAGKIESQQGILYFNTTLGLTTGANLAGAGNIVLGGTINLSALLNSTGKPELTGTLNATTPASGFSGTQPLVWSNGVITGTFTLESGSTVNLTGATTAKRLGTSSRFVNKGRVNYIEGRIQGDNSSTFDNESGAVFDCTTDGNVFSNDYAGNVFNNKAGALILKSGKTAAPDGATTLDDWTFNNSGTLRSDAGLLIFNTALNLNAGGTVSRIGTTAARVASSGTMTLTGTTTVSNVTLESTGVWQGNTVPGTAGNGTLATTAGGVFEWAGGTFGNTASLAPASQWLISGNGPKDLASSAVLKNNGTATWTGTGALLGQGSSTFENLSGSIFNVATDADFTNSYTGNRVVVASGATFRKTAGSDVTDCDWRLENAGITRGDTGVFAFSRGGGSSGTFTCGATGEIRFTGGQHDLNTNALFDGTGKIRVQGGTLVAVGNVNSNSSSALFEVASGLVTSSGAGAFNAVGNIRWSGGTIGGVFNILAGSSAILAEPGSKTIATSSVINNFGTVTRTGGVLLGDNSSTWNNKPGSSFIIAGDGDVLANTYAGNVFNNEANATFVKTTGAGGAITSTIDDWAFYNAGKIESQQGTLYFNTTLGLTTGANLAGAGNILLGGTINLAALVTSTGKPELIGTLNATTSAARFSGTPPLVWSDGLITGTFTLESGSTVNLTGATTAKRLGTSSRFVNKGRVNYFEGRIQGDNSSTFDNESGAVFDCTTDGNVFSNEYSGNVFNNKAGALILKSGKTAALDGASTLDDWTFHNSGTLRSDTGLLRFDTALNLNAGGTVSRIGTTAARVMSSGTMTLTGTTTVSNVTFENSGNCVGNTASGTAGNGTLATAAGGVFEWTQGAFFNTATLAAGSQWLISGSGVKYLGSGAVLRNGGTVTRTGTGPLQGEGGSTFENLAGGVFNVATSAAFTNNYGGNRLTNHGTLNIGSPVGISPVQWNFTQGATGRINVDIGGSGAATPDFDQLNISGDAVLAGSIGVTLVNGFTPVANAEFPVVTFGGGRTGTFASVTAAGSTWALKHDPNSVSVVAKTKPTNFPAWVSYHFVNPASNDALASGDPDKDGLSNIVEYGFGLNPLVGNASPTVAGIVEISGSRYLSLTYTRPAGPAILTDISYVGERSPAMANATWSAAGVTTHSVTMLPSGEEERVVLRSTQAISGAAKDFIRAKLVVTPAN